MFLRNITYFLILSMLVFMVGCNEQAENEATPEEKKLEEATQPPENHPDIEGTITQVDPGKILVVEDPDQPEVTNKAEVQLEDFTRYWVEQGKTHEEGKKEDLQKGMKVKVWYTGIIMDSYPVKTKGGHVIYEKK